MALSSTGEECASTSDASCRDEIRCRFDESLARSAITTLHLPPEPRFHKVPSRSLLPCDSRRLPSTSARSIHHPFRGHESRTRARHRSSGFAALIRLPTLFRRLAPKREMARPRPLPNALHARALLATRRSSTSAIKTICKHDLRTSKPGLARANSLSRIRLAIARAACADPRIAIKAARFSSNRFFLRCPVAITKISLPVLPDYDFNRMGAEDSRVRGRLVRGDPEIAAPASLHDNRLSWRLRPNPIGSNTSCRAARVDYDRSTVIESTSAPANAIERIRC